MLRLSMAPISSSAQPHSTLAWILRALGLSEHIATVTFFTTHVQLILAFGTLLVPRLLLFLPRLCRLFAGSVKLNPPLFVSMLDGTLRMDPIFGVGRLTANRAGLAFSRRVSKRPGLIRHVPPRSSS